MNMSPQQLVQNVLLGPGVTVSNIQFTGAPISIGYFGGNSNVGIKDGIVITTGTVNNNGNGPHGPNISPSAGEDNFAPGSALLASQLGGQTQTYNAATLEFDFVPFSDTVTFKYVFASEEYPEYSGTDFNDIFGFFISGPGIGGQQNIARVPGTGQVVAINNINNGQTNTGPCMNCAYYIDNSAQNNTITRVQYDGFSTTLTAMSKVQCGQTYHLVIAIADVGDALFDSGIFLEANSLTSETPVDITYSLSQQAYPNPSVLAEGCVSATIHLTREGNISNSLTVPITKSGIATELVDYSAIPNSVTFPAGVDSLAFSFDAFQDGIIEGEESLILEFALEDACGNQTPYVINLAIGDVLPVDVVLEDETIFCPGDEITLTPAASGGVGPYTYLWSNSETTLTITVNPITTTSYSVKVTDNCLLESDSTTATVTVPVYDPIALTITDDITVICPYISDTLNVIASGGSGTYTYIWSANGIVVGFNPYLYITPPVSTNYKVIVTDQCGIEDSAFMDYAILSPPLTLTVSEDLEICPGEEVNLSVEADGGFGSYHYFWPKTEDTTAQVTTYPTQTGYYQVIVSDDCATFTVTDSIKVNVIRPLADFRMSSRTVYEGIPITFQNLTINGVSFEWDFGDGNTSTLVHPNNTFPSNGNYTITMIATNALGCTDTIKKVVEIFKEVYLYVPNTFTPDGDRFNNTFKASTIGIIELETEIYNRWGDLIFESDDVRFEWDGRHRSGKTMPQGVYNYKINYVTVQGERIQKNGHIVLLK
jgi:gliding motility-associated-like protein